VSAPRAFHESLPGYAPTPLLDAPQLAAEWGASRVSLKFERERFGLPAFKFLGASWAVRQLLGEPPYDPATTLVAATAGNHGRAVARVAGMNGIRAHILVPAGTVPARIEAIESEGATVEVVDGTYDDAVRRSIETEGVLLSDTSWPGYTDVPTWVIEGYATIFEEIDEQLDDTPDLAVIPCGVGALAAAAAHRYEGEARLAGVEPTVAACLGESMRAGHVVEVPGPHDSVMAGLNAGVPSLVAWPVIQRAFSEFVTVDDEEALAGIARLAQLGLDAGEVSGGAIAGAAKLARPDEHVLVLLTEGVTSQSPEK
jgi:diaminopropionate ammonia-lyase